MARFKRFLFGFVFVLIALAWAGCAARPGPLQIASYPIQPTPGPAQIFPPPEQAYPWGMLSAYLEIGVTDVTRAVQRAEEMAYHNDGTLVSQSSWVEQNELRTSVTLAVPTHYSHRLITGLEALGDLRRKEVTSDVEDAPMSATADGSRLSYITVVFFHQGFTWPEIQIGGWNPGRTIANAFAVFVTIFGFLADLVLWLAIVLGPFALIGWGLWALLHRKRKAM